MIRLEFLGLADGATFETRPVPELALKFDGIQGDRHAGPTMKSGVRQTHLPRGTLIRNARQLSVLGAEELAGIAAELGIPRLAPEWLGANLVLSGVSELTAMAPSTRLLFPSGASVVIDGDNDPCVISGGAVAQGAGDPSLKQRFVKAAMGRRGLVGWVEAEGVIRQGESVTVVPR